MKNTVIFGILYKIKNSGEMVVVTDYVGDDIYIADNGEGTTYRVRSSDLERC